MSSLIAGKVATLTASFRCMVGPESDDSPQRLRYKDFHLAARPAAVEVEVDNVQSREQAPTGLFETDSVKDFASKMEDRGVLDWWRKAMRYSGSEDRL